MSYSGSDSLEDIYKLTESLLKDSVDHHIWNTKTLKILQEHIEDLENQNEILINEIDRLKG